MAAGGDGLYAGLMSGTSADAIDVALVRFEDERCQLIAGHAHPWPDALRAELVALGQGTDTIRIDRLGELDALVGDAFAEAARAALAEAGIPSKALVAIGSHGQTIRHRPGATPPFTMQIGDPTRITEALGVATVADFRRRDVAAGGQGAPLVPAFHAAVLGSTREDRVVLNLGGIGNITLLPRAGGVRGFDTGPANALLDAWCQRHTGAPYDVDGAFAARGQVDGPLLARLLYDPWFALPPPKSTGREQFHLAWVDAARQGNETAEDVQATLLALAATTIADAIRAYQSTTARVLACGGGVRNPLLLGAIGARLPRMQVESTALHGVDPDYMEAMAFAWLARETLAGRPGNRAAVTGARGPRVLGAIYPA